MTTPDPTLPPPAAAGEYPPNVFPGATGIPADDPAAIVAAGNPAGRDNDSPLAAILEAVQQEIAPQSVTWGVPGRPAMAVRYRTDISDADMKSARKAAGKGGKRMPDGSRELDDLMMAQWLLGRYCTGVLWQGQEALEDDNETPLTFRSSVLWRTLGVSTTTECVAKVYGTDGGVVAAGRALMDASGWTDDPEDAEAGPTRA